MVTLQHGVNTYNFYLYMGDPPNVIEPYILHILSLALSIRSYKKWVPLDAMLISLPALVSYHFTSGLIACCGQYSSF